MDDILLRLDGVSKHFGGLKAVDEVSFSLRRGEILGLIGPNGAGKTTCFNLVSGIYSPTLGNIIFEGVSTGGFPPHKMAALGVGRTFQVVKPFSTLSVLQNVMVALGLRRYGGVFSSFARWETASVRKEALSLLEEVGIAHLAETPSGKLPLGNQRRLELARALALKPKLLLLDETFSGLRHEEVALLSKLVLDVRSKGISVLLIEHNMKVAMGLSDRLVVLDHGRLLAEGSAEAVRSDPAVIEAYLGKGASSMLLEVSDLSVFYGDIRAVDGLTLSLREGELVSVIGANGAGKSSLLNCIMGIVPRKNGTISFLGEDVSALSSHKRAARGIRFVPERARVFPRLTVYENILTGCYRIRDKIDFAGTLKWLYTLFPVLEERSGQLASTLSGGEQQMLAISRALIAEPKLLLVDEVSMGLMPVLVDKVFDVLKMLNRERGLSILLVEQNARASLGISHRSYVLETGKIVLEGESEALLKDPKVQEAYLGL